ncbi:MAG: hypothetical protein LBT40_11360 [Deltaproteobacteria bacterium]|jgi:hypothetical protein|nr:hypothetical protein [Deltaproteobacteria bacterium]
MGDAIVLVVILVFAVIGLVYYVGQIRVYRLNYALKAFLETRRDDGNARNAAHDRLMATTLRLLLSDGVTRAMRASGRLERKNSSMRARIAVLVEERPLIRGGSGVSGAHEGRDGLAQAGTSPAGGPEDGRLRSLRRAIAANYSRIRRMNVRSSRMLCRQGVELSADELDRLATTASGRDLIESAVAVKNVCDMSGRLCSAVAHDHDLDEVRGTMTIFVTVLEASRGHAGSLAARILDVYLPRLDEMIAGSGGLGDPGGLREAVSRASGGPAGLTAMEAAGRALEDYRGILTAHGSVLRDRRDALSRVRDSVRDAMNALEPDEGPAVRIADISFNGGGSPASFMREAAGELKRILNDKAAWPGAWGKGREAVFRELTEQLLFRSAS